MRISSLWRIVFAGVAAQPLWAQSAPSNRIMLQDFLETENVHDFFRGGGPEISPDGKQVVYTRWWIDKINDQWKSSLWLVNSDGTKNRWLVDGGSQKWSPDGTRLAFTKAAEGGGPQIFVRYMDAEGSVTQITRLETAPGNLRWSPDGKWIAFTSMVPSASKWAANVPGRPAGAKWTAEPKIVDRLNFRSDWVGYVDGGYSQIFVVSASGGTARQLTSGDWNCSQIEWSHDGNEILFTSLRVPDAEYQWRESEIYAVNLSTKAIRQLTHHPGPDGGAAVSPDGRWVAYTGFDQTDDTYITNKLYLMGIDGSNPREISGHLDRTPTSLLWAGDGSGIYFTADDRGRSDVYFVSIQGGEPKKLTSGDHMLSLLSLSPSGIGAGILSTPSDPGNVVVMDVKNPNLAPRQVTDVNGDVLAGKAIAPVEEIWYPSVDGFKIQGWIMKPPGFDPHKKYPLMLSIHGGPHGMFAVSTPYMWWEWQIYAAQGYVVLYTNPRGSSGYGSAFGNAIKNAYPGKDYDDLMAGVDTVINRGYIDSKNMFVYGCSGGGVLTTWVVGHTDRFAAASAECPVTDWLSFVGTTDGAGWYYNFAKMPWEDPTEHLRRSPLMYVGNVKTPTMLVTGEKDLRTPMPQTEEYYRALKMRKVPSLMVRLQDEWHAYFNHPANTMRTVLLRQEWFEKYRQGDKPVP